jgi:hypothetical protein
MAFQQRLEHFASLLKEDRDIDIEIRDPKDFDLAYILQAMEKIEQHKDKEQSYRPFIKKCCRKYESNKSIVKGILGLVPNDLYGSLISGGFTLILAVSTCI